MKSIFGVWTKPHEKKPHAVLFKKLASQVVRQILGSNHQHLKLMEMFASLEGT